MHDGCPAACVDDAAFGYVDAFRSHVNVGFFLGSLLKDPARLAVRASCMDESLRVIVEASAPDVRHGMAWCGVAVVGSQSHRPGF